MHRTGMGVVVALLAGSALGAEAPPRFVVTTLPTSVPGALELDYQGVTSPGAVYAVGLTPGTNVKTLVRIEPDGFVTITENIHLDPDNLPDNWLQVWDWNDSGTVVGLSTSFDLAEDVWIDTSFRYQFLFPGFAVMDDFGVLTGHGPGLRPTSINEAGDVLFHETPVGPAVWRPGGGLEALAAPGLLVEPWFGVMGGDGSVGGRFLDTDGFQRGFAWDTEGVRVLESFANPTGVNIASNVSDINANGWAVGTTHIPWDFGLAMQRPCVDRGDGTELLSEMVDGELSGFASAVTDDNVIYGHRNGVGAGVWRRGDLEWWTLTELLPPDVAYQSVTFQEVSRLGAALAYATNPGWPIGDRVTLIPAGPGDYNADGVRDLGDVQLFIAEFVARARLADRNQDGVHDLADLQSWIAEFVSR